VSIAAGPFAIAALLLAVAGAMKVASPADTANALRGAGLPASPRLVRAGGAIEALGGAYAFIEGDLIGAVLVALSYVLFAAFVAFALACDLPISTCGCFGKTDTPPSRVHLVFNLAAVIAAVTIAIDPSAGIADAVGSQPLSGVPFVMLVVIGTGLSLLTLSALPRVLASVREAQ